MCITSFAGSLPLKAFSFSCSARMHERVISSQYSVLSVCANNIWEITPLQPLKYAPNKRTPYFIGFKCADFLTNAAVSEKKESQKLGPLKIVLCVTPPFKVSGIDRHPDRTEIYLRLHIQGKSKAHPLFSVHFYRSVLAIPTSFTSKCFLCY